MRTVDVAPEGTISQSTVATIGGETEYRSQRRAVQAWTAALILLCAGSLWLQFRHIERTLPYPHHIDEQHVAGPAGRMLIDGNLNPREFATASYALANPWQPSWLLTLFRRWGIVAY